MCKMNATELGIAALASLLCLLGGESVRAATFEVSTTADNGAGSLRDAITMANATAGADTIAFTTLGADMTITVGVTPLPAISEDLVIDGTTATNLSLVGNGVDEIFQVASGTTSVQEVRLDTGDLEIEMGANLTLIRDSDVEIDENIVNPGSLTKQGAAILTLTGTNNYAGGTTVEAGTLVGNTASLQGDITNNASVVFDQAANGTYAGVMTGTGNLEKKGMMRLILNGASTYSGGTTISEGTLEIGPTGSIQGDVRNDAMLVFNQNADSSFAGNITGTGSLDKEGVSKLTLTGTNSYAGGTSVIGGLLEGTTSSIQGPIVAGATTEVIFNQSTNGAYSGAMSGAGRLVKEGTGSVTLSGANIYVGGTQINAGTLVGDATSLQGAITNFSTLTFNQAADGTFTGTVLGGTGIINKTGAGTLTINTAVSGATLNHSGGRLNIDSMVIANLVSGSGATLGGTGTINGTATVGGRLDPGDPGMPSGNLAILMNTDFDPGSVLDVRVGNAANMNNLVSVTGTADFNPGARVSASIVSAPVAATNYDLVTATGGLPGTTPTLIQDFAFFTETLTQGANALTLTLAPTGGPANTLAIAATPNQMAVAAAFDALPAGPGVTDVRNEMGTATLGQVLQTLDDLGGDALSAVITSDVALANQLDRIAHSRVRRASQLNYGPIFSTGRSTRRLTNHPGRDELPSVDSDQPRRRATGPWVDMIGLSGDLDGDGNTADIGYGIVGSTLGFDFAIGDNFLVGFGGGYARTNLDFDDRGGDGDIDTVHGLLYGGYFSEHLHLGVSVRFADNSIDTERDITVGAFSQTAKADFDGSTIGARLELGLSDLRLGKFYLQPLGSIGITRSDQDGFTETGAPGLNLTVDDEEVDSVQGGLGFRLYRNYFMDEGTWITPELSLRWLHEFGDEDRRIRAAFEAAPATFFIVEGTELPSDTGQLHLGWTATTSDQLQFYMNYDGQFSSDLLEHSLSLGARFLW